MRGKVLTGGRSSPHDCQLQSSDMRSAKSGQKSLSARSSSSDTQLLSD